MASSPTFVCEFSDGEVTRMSVHQEKKSDRLDVERGVRLACCAHFSRKHEAPPAIVKARFEKDGVLLQSYSAVDLEDIAARPIEDFDAKALLAERRQAEEDARRAYLLNELADDADEEPPL